MTIELNYLYILMNMIYEQFNFKIKKTKKIYEAKNYAAKKKLISSLAVSNESEP